MAKKKVGFARLTPEERAELGRKGGLHAHESGTAHRWTPEEAAEAGKRGGKARVHKGGRPKTAPEE